VLERQRRDKEEKRRTTGRALAMEQKRPAKEKARSGVGRAAHVRRGGTTVFVD
jgi:hypothetical protein